MDGEERMEERGTGGTRIELDSLLTPSVQQHQPRMRHVGARPWRLSSQLWVAFFGGVLPITVISYLNGKRLRLSLRQLQQIVLVGIVGLAAVLIATYLVGQTGLPVIGSSQRTQLRLVHRVISVVTYLIFVRLQRPADRQYESFSDDYDSLWIPGLIAIFGLGFLQSLLITAVVGLLV